MEQLNVDYYAVSSTTQCEEDYPKVLSEMEELISIDGKKVLPIMWITPEALQGNIAWYLESEIKWRMIKIHPFLNQMEWNPEGESFQEVLDIARELQIPLLVHTGNEKCCRGDLYEDAIKDKYSGYYISALNNYEVYPVNGNYYTWDMLYYLVDENINNYKSGLETTLDFNILIKEVKE